MRFRMPDEEALHSICSTRTHNPQDPAYAGVMAVLRQYAWVVFVLFAVLATLFGVFPGAWFEPEVDQGDALLVTTYAGVAVVLTVAMAVIPFRRGERWAWLAFWVWPLFFLAHGFAFFVVDFVFAALGVAALALTAPTHRSSVAPTDPPF